MNIGIVRSAHPSTDSAGRAPRTGRPFPIWPLSLLALPAGVAIWAGWVALGELCGFGPVHLLPGIADKVTINSAITLPIGMESYAAYALRAWLSGGVPDRARKFARSSAIAALVVGSLGQITYHLLAAAGAHHAPWPVTMVVSCIPVAVLGMGAALAHLVRSEPAAEAPAPRPEPLPEAPVSPAPPTFDSIVSELGDVDRPQSPAEWVARADAVLSRHPELTATQVAAAVGCSDRHLRACRNKLEQERAQS